MRGKLTLKQKRFIEAYLQTGNATEAARRAGYSGSEEALRVIGSQNLTKLNIKRRIQNRVAEEGVTTDEVIGTLASQMRADVTDLFDERGGFDVTMIRERGLGHLIKKLKVRKETFKGPLQQDPAEIIEIEFHNQQSAAIQLCKVLGIEREPAPNDETKRRDLADRMLRKLLGNGLNETEARNSLISLGVDPADIPALQSS